jgi:dolichyl-phosphate beta-glucosyltransferase
VIARVAPLLTVRQWAFDVELLYLCKKYGFSIKEVATEWHDRAGSKLRISSGFKMLSELVRVRLRHG